MSSIINMQEAKLPSRSCSHVFKIAGVIALYNSREC